MTEVAVDVVVRSPRSPVSTPSSELSVVMLLERDGSSMCARSVNASSALSWLQGGKQVGEKRIKEREEKTVRASRSMQIKENKKTRVRSVGQYTSSKKRQEQVKSIQVNQ